MLSEEEKNRIRLEEEALAREKMQQKEQLQKAKALEAYRASVKAKVQGSRGQLWFWLLVAACLLVSALVLGSMLIPAPPKSENTTGGMADSIFAEQCQAQIRAEEFSDSEELQFSQTAIISNNEGKQWDGTVSSNNKQLEFSCTYTTISSQVKVEIIR